MSARGPSLPRPGRLAALATLLALAACSAVGPDYSPPEASIPAGWSEQAPGLNAAPADVEDWWRQLNDPVLDSLVERAVRQGLDVREALARVREARALRGVAAADQWPTLDANLLWERRGESDSTPLGSFVPDTTLYRAGFDAAWELDIWGRVRRSVEAADADLGATVEDARGIVLTVVAETARTYVDLRAFQRRIDIARTNVALQEESLALAQTRLDAGLVGDRDVAQAQTTVETTRSRVPALEVGRRAAENRLAVLLDLPPGELAAELAEDRPVPVPPAEVAVGVPADLLRRRPDVRSAERALAAETARIGVAEGDLYPRLVLLGTLGVAADDPGDVADRDSSFFSFGPAVRWNLFDGGRLRNRVEAQDARAEQAQVRWERTVLAALEEAENAMTGLLREQARRESLQRAETEALRAVELAQTEYREGLTDFQAVVDTERTVADLQDDLAQSEATIATQAVALYKALGGGWEHADPVARGD
jgi:NodT family efflux transporter outer membrane factor (OMF) lipoprotein